MLPVRRLRRRRTRSGPPLQAVTAAARALEMGCHGLFSQLSLKCLDRTTAHHLRVLKQTEELGASLAMPCECSIAPLEPRVQSVETPEPSNMARDFAMGIRAVVESGRCA
ncbi:hypothetical protein EJ03DRAFT_332268 [Teratosphaeria nubilosa]|uniref:Uncharacterized protein n=1 Tax=Teratosphaeria nubilosa TaxID=161662 RepID=A0A6G1KUQ1_9PEZI|nr:hypothetical protein EJ03DRAFT_332268 [Teratosphaeria nubilosa]